jgi:hypothetical protein
MQLVMLVNLFLRKKLCVVSRTRVNSNKLAFCYNLGCSGSCKVVVQVVVGCLTLNWKSAIYRTSFCGSNMKWGF